MRDGMQDLTTMLRPSFVITEIVAADRKICISGSHSAHRAAGELRSVACMHGVGFCRTHCRRDQRVLCQLQP